MNNLSARRAQNPTTVQKHTQTPTRSHDHNHNQTPSQQHGQAACVSSASCPWVLSPVPNPEGWSLQQCADLGCVPEVPDVEQCMPPSTGTTQSPSQSSENTFPPPVPIDFTTTSSRSPSVPQTFDASSPTNPIPTNQPASRPALSRKRRSSPAPSEDPKPAPAPAASTKPKAARPTKVAHSVVEQRYRDNLNGKIAQLHKTLSTTKGSGSSSSDEGEGDTVLPRTRKADVLASAIAYIKEAERNRQKFESEVDFLKTRITMLEKLVKCEDCNILTQMNQMRLQAGFAI